MRSRDPVLLRLLSSEYYRRNTIHLMLMEFHTERERAGKDHSTSTCVSGRSRPGTNRQTLHQKEERTGQNSSKVFASLHGSVHMLGLCHGGGTPLWRVLQDPNYRSVLVGCKDAPSSRGQSKCMARVRAFLFLSAFGIILPTGGKAGGAPVAVGFYQVSCISVFLTEYRVLADTSHRSLLGSLKPER